MLSCTPAYIGRRMMHKPGIMPKVGAVQVSTGRSLIPSSNSRIGRGRIRVGQRHGMCSSFPRLSVSVVK